MKRSNGQQIDKNGNPPWIQRHRHYEPLASWTNSDGRSSSGELCSAPLCSDQARTASLVSRASSERPYTRPGSLEYFGHCIEKSSSLTSLSVGFFDFSDKQTTLLRVGKTWVIGPMHSGPVFKIYTTFSLPVLSIRIPQTTPRSLS